MLLLNFMYKKILYRACKKDDPEEMLTRQILGKWNIV